MIDHHIVPIAVVPACYHDFATIRRYNRCAGNALAVGPIDVNRLVAAAITA